MRLILASTSPARLATLRAVGIEPVAIAPLVDEDAAVAAAGPLTAAEMVQLLARLKAEAVLDPAVCGGAGFAPSDLDGFILGGDSAFELDGTVFGKPHEPEIARERWLAQRGRSGVLHSGHWLIDHRGGRLRGAVGRASSATVHFADDIEESEIDAYIATGEPLKVAGAFTIDSKGAGFIDRIEGDPHTVVGLSVPLVRKLVHELGGRWTELWNR
ncbi:MULTISPECIES: nucleoside triphosphate pyrophosphatase [unclassified Microcella]|uniref:Maf family protein n=1 Tax=unclassified Microcella TaxID=2630066 RepID=UPI001F472DFA|nr:MULTISPECIES: nucleoside triphosphate pyrophosphatase [unclassified Microcella]